MLLKIKRLPLRKAHTNYGTIIGFGICNFAVSYLLLYYGTIYSTAALVTLIFSLKAITTPIFLRIVFKTPLQNKIYIGGALGLLSVVIILYPDLHTISSSFLLGIGLAAVGTIVTSIGDVFSYYNNEKNIDPVRANTIGMLVATLSLLVFAFATAKDFVFPTSLHYWGGLLYLAIFASFIAWLLYLLLVKHMGAAESSYMVALFPAIGGFASVVIGESALSWNLVLGIVLAVLGTFIALSKKKKSEFPG